MRLLLFAEVVGILVVTVVYSLLVFVGARIAVKPMEVCCLSAKG